MRQRNARVCKNKYLNKSVESSTIPVRQGRQIQQVDFCPTNPIEQSFHLPNLDMAAILPDSKLIPRIDMTWPEDKIAEAVEQAALCDGPGFFYILNHGIEESIFENAIRESHEFFHSPKFLDERQQISSLNQFGRWGSKGMQRLA